jgi:uncharacterized HAD superfamily protein
MRIGIDIDNTLTPTFRTIINYMNKKYNLKQNPKMSKEASGYDLFHSDFKSFFSDWKQFIKSKDHENMKPIKDSINVILKLSKNNQIYIITARDHSQKIPTIIWIDKHYKNKFEEILFIDYYEEKHTKKYTKGDLCKKFKIDVMIEDCTTEIKDIIKKNKKIKVFLFNNNNKYNWNREKINSKRIKTVFNWKEIYKNIALFK